MSFQPRYVAYAKAHGNNPETQLETDQNMLGFILWINAKWVEYKQLMGLGNCLSKQDHNNFDSWLKKDV